MKVSEAVRKSRRVARFLSSPHSFFEAEYRAGDGIFAVSGVNLDAFEDPVFRQAWENAHFLNKEGWSGNAPDIRWRAHVACWAANSALRTCAGGDLAEFGVHTGLISLMLCRATDFLQRGQRLFLFDTFNGIPRVDSLGAVDRARALDHNERLYFDCLDLVERNFKEYGDGVEIVPGILPDSLNDVDIQSLCFVHIDLNNAPSEIGVISQIWDRILPSGFILLDDYGWSSYRPQYDACNDFCRSVDHYVLTLPTGQGLIIKGSS